MMIFSVIMNFVLIGHGLILVIVFQFKFDEMNMIIMACHNGLRRLQKGMGFKIMHPS